MNALARILQTLLWAVLSVLLCMGAYWSIRLAAADHLSRSDSLHDVQRSTQLGPGNVRYLAHLAEFETGDGQNASATLRQALAASPLDSAAWIQLGLQAEQNGDMAAAEEALLHAAQVDRQFRPRWVLASFYVRRNDARRFWPWASQALELAHHEDLPALFRLCRNMSSQPEDVLRVIPRKPEALQEYVGFLLNANDLDAAGPAAERLAEVAQKAQTPYLLWYCQTAIMARRTAEAVSIWNRTSERGLIPYPAIDPAQGKSLINGDFQQPTLGLAFDWHLPDINGISARRDESSPILRVSFSGKQPESCEPVLTWVVLEPSRKYRLKCRYETTGIPRGAGLRWQLFDAEKSAPVIVGSPDLSHEGQTTAEAEFQTPAGFRLGRFALTYQRATGTTRIEGVLQLTNVSLEFAR